MEGEYRVEGDSMSWVVFRESCGPMVFGYPDGFWLPRWLFATECVEAEIRSVSRKA